MARRRWVRNVYGERREITRRWPDGSYECPWCFGPVLKGSPGCQNPACEAATHMTVAQADKMRERAAAKAAQEAEWARLRGLRYGR